MFVLFVTESYSLQTCEEAKKVLAKSETTFNSKAL